MIVLSHSKPFLCGLWDSANKNDRRAFKIIRSESGSNFSGWNVRQDSITEHDKRHELITNYIRLGNHEKEREVAQALRPVLESFIRTAYPPNFPPGSLLGNFISRCQDCFDRNDEILSRGDTNELRLILDYANKFHHDTNRAYETENINDTELMDFAKRTLSFASRRN